MPAFFYGDGVMEGMWIGLLVWAATKNEIVTSFKEETGLDLPNMINSRGINAMIDKATGYDRAVVVAWADFVTKHLWGEEEREAQS